MTTYCRYCDDEITFSEDYVSERTGKKIPLDVDTEEPHDCPIRRAHHRKFYDCNRGCGFQIYFDKMYLTESGKWIPVDKQTGLPHTCAGRSKSDLGEES
jgi:hypothetical protein